MKFTKLAGAIEPPKFLNEKNCYMIILIVRLN